MDAPHKIVNSANSIETEFLGENDCRQSAWIKACVCFFNLCHLLFHYKRGYTQALCCACKTDQADFIDWMSFLPHNFVENISPNTEAISGKSLLSSWGS